jgi:YVTN family beta-propeller protein
MKTTHRTFILITVILTIFIIGSFQIWTQTSSQQKYLIKAYSSHTQPDQSSISGDGTKVGSLPRSVAVNPITNTVYVANSDSKTISVIDGITNKLVSSIPVENTPVKMAVNPNTNKIYVVYCDPQGGSAHADCSSISVIDGKTNKIVSRIAEDVKANDIAVNPDTNKIYVAEDFSNTVYSIDGNTNRVVSNITLVRNPTQIAIGNIVVNESPNANLLPTSIAINPNTNTVYVANRNNDILSVIDGSKDRVSANITVMQKPDAVAVNPKTNMVYVSNEDANRVSIIDGKTNRVLSTVVMTNNYPTDKNNYSEISVNPSTNMVYVTDKYTNSLSLLNGTTDRIVKITSLGNWPSDVSVNSKTNIVYVTIMNANTVSTIDGTTGNLLNGSLAKQTSSFTPSVKVDSGPLSLAINPNTNKIYVIYEFSNKLSVIDGATDTVTDSITLRNITNAIAVNPTTNMIYVAHRDADSVSVIDGKTNKVVTRIPDGGGPVAIAVNSNTNIVYVANYLSNTAFVIDGMTNRIIANPNNSSDTGLQDIAVDPNTNRVYMAKDDVYTVSIINGIREFGRLDSSNIYGPVSNVTVGSGPFNVWPRQLAFSLTINPNIDMIYASNWVHDMIGVIDGETNKVVANITGVGTPERMAVNPNTNMLYTLDPISGITYVIDLQTNSIVSRIRTGSSTFDVAANPTTNMVYVTSRDSDSLSVIDGKTNTLVTGIRFSVSPANAGFISCNGRKVTDNYSRFDIGVPIQCEANANSGFAFSSWSGDLASNSLNPVQFAVPQFGKKLNANFIVPTEVVLPKEFFNGLIFLMTTFIIGPTLAWFIPYIASWSHSKKQRKQLSIYMTKIDTFRDNNNYERNQNNDDILANLRGMMKDIENAYVKDKISESQYNLLKNMVDQNVEQIKDHK